MVFLKEKLDGLEEKRKSKNNFLKAVRSFMEMKTLNPVILRELVEKIEVYQIEGTGKNRTQRVVIHYRFVGCLQIPEWHRKRKSTLESRQGVAITSVMNTRYGTSVHNETTQKILCFTAFKTYSNRALPIKHR